MSPASPIVRPG